MKRIIPFILLGLVLCSFNISAQKKEPVTAINGKQVAAGEGWKIFRLYKDAKDKVTLFLAYQESSVVKITAGTFKAWIKIKSYKKDSASTDYTLISYQVKCKTREIHTSQIIEYMINGKKKNNENPDAEFEEVVPDSLDEDVFIAICDEYDK